MQDTQLRKVQEGIYSLGSSAAAFPGQKPVVAVHPYFNIKLSDKGRILEDRTTEKCYVGNNQIPYVKALESLITFHKGPLIVLEGESDLARTAKRIERLWRKAVTYFIKTVDSDSQPSELSWGATVDFIKSFGNDVRLVGGYLQDPDYSDHYAPGCLGMVRDILMKNNFKVDLSRATF